jgi:outer membrane lipoprotein SlyB
MMKGFLQVLLAIAVVSATLGCAAKRPALYPNEHLDTVGTEAAQRDIDDCLKQAAAAGLKPGYTGEVAKSTALGAATGAVMGTAVGAVTGRPGAAAAAGAAGGGVSGLLRGLFSSRDLDPSQRQAVDDCLRDKGYQVKGWR